jgi:hypothetical protein
VAGSVNLMIGCFIAGQTMVFGNVVPALVVGVFAYGISIVLYVTSAQNLGATRSQILFSTAPIWGVLLSYLFNHEPFQWVHLISIILLGIAVIMTSRLSHKHFHTHMFIEHVHFHQHTDGHHDHSHDDEPVQDVTWHSHGHIHDPSTHEHSHYPDLHHRHGHK